MAAPAPLDTLRAGLAGLRHRIWALFLAHGLARAVLALCLALVTFYAADVLLDLPLGVRRFVRLGLVGSPGLLPWGLAVPLGAALWLLALLLTRGGRGAAGFVAFLGGGLVAWFGYWGWRALRPLKARLSDEELVLAVERRHPALQDRLASALDFARELASPGRSESAPMMQAVVEQASRASREVAFGRALSAVSTRAWVGSAGAALLLVVGVVALDPASAALFARRSLLAQDVAWPRATEVRAVALGEDGAATPWDPARPFEVAVGRSVTVHAEVRGRAAQEVLLLDLAEDQPPLPRRMFAVAGRPGLYAVELTNVRQGFRFILRAGDDEDDEPVYRVVASVPPSVLEIGAELAFPAYLGRPAERVQGGNLAVPQGTRVTVTFSASTPLQAARAAVGDEVVAAERLSADGGGEAWRFAFTAERPLRYRLLLTAADGRPSDAGADVYEVAVDEDRAPRLEWLWPRASVDVTPDGRVPLLVRALDDHAVTALRLDLQLGPEGEVRPLRLLPRQPETGLAAPELREGGLEVEALDGPLGRARVLAYVALDLAALRSSDAPAAPSLQVRAVAQDSRGQLKEGPWQTLQVVGAPELERALTSRRAALRAAVEALTVEQRARREQVRALEAGTLGDAEKDQLKSLQFAQGRIEVRSGRIVRDFFDLFAGYVLDRLGAENPNERILALFDRHHRTTFGQASGLAAEDDPVFPVALFAAVVDAWRTRALLDTGVLDRMCAVLAEAVEVTARLAPAAHAAAVRASASGLPADVNALGAAQSALQAALDRMLGSMASWESLADVIVRVRRVLEQQKGLLEQMDQELKRSEARPPGDRPPAPAPAGVPGGR